MTPSFFLDRPVFICGAPRNGTTLLISLLDGHTRLLAIPFEPVITERYTQYERHGQEALRSFFVRDYLHSFDVQSIINLDYVDVRSRIAKERFGEHTRTPRLPNLGEDVLHCFREAYSRTLAASTGPGFRVRLDAPHRALAAAYTVFFPETKPEMFVQRRPLVNEVQALRLKRVFPSARFVHILRDPRSRYLSAKTRRTYRSRFGPRFVRSVNGRDPASHRAAISMTSFELARRNKQVLGEDYFILRYEDLVSDQTETLESICGFLGIPYEDVLEHPTRMSQRTSPNSSLKQTRSQVSKTALQRCDLFYKETSTIEQEVVHYFCARIAGEYGYEMPVSPALSFSNRLAPIRYEHPFDYWRNRRGSLRMLGDNFVYVMNLFFDDIVESIDEGRVPDM